MAYSNVIFIVGPTGTGKTEAALNLRHLSAIEIINADSRQVYQGLSIGTAKPSLDEQALVPHHLFDVLSPDIFFSIAEYLEIARNKINQILANGITPVVVGGTGQYIWGLIEGWQIPAVPPNYNLRKFYETYAEENGSKALYAKLLDVDPKAVSFINASNIRRIIRALEVWEHTGVPFSKLRQQIPPNYNYQVFAIYMNRVDLYKKLDDRITSMIESGWINEIKDLLAQGFNVELPAFSSAGYRELAAYVKGDMAYSEAIEKTKSATHRLVRSQYNWFKHSDDRITWLKSTDELNKTKLFNY